ncbi:hypothetical protein HDV05_003136, partial [Chytridiales sp. JEL 0842]
MANVLRGAIGVSSTCVEKEKVVKLPQLCKETCMAFQDSFLKARSDASVCQSQTEASARALQGFQNQVQVLASMCGLLRSKNDPVPENSLPCVEMSLSDWASCGFGNTTTGLAAARSFCSTSPNEKCCTFLGSSPNQISASLGSPVSSGLKPGSSSNSDNTGLLVGSLLGTLALVLIVGGVVYKFYKKKRALDSAGKGGFSTATSDEGIRTATSKGLIVGARSRLSFAPSKRGGNAFQELQLKNAVAPPMP